MKDEKRRMEEESGELFQQNQQVLHCKSVVASDVVL